MSEPITDAEWDAFQRAVEQARKEKQARQALIDAAKAYCATQKPQGIATSPMQMEAARSANKSLRKAVRALEALEGAEG